MKSLRKFLALTASERRLLVSGALWLVAMRLGLWMLPFRTMVSLLPRVVPEGEPAWAGARWPPEKVGWAVRVASRYLPGARNCLVQALTAQRLLARHSHAARLCFGVAKADGEGVKAHAWVECAGKIVIGGGGVPGYTELASFQAPHRESPTVFPGQGKLSEVRGQDLP